MTKQHLNNVGYGLPIQLLRATVTTFESVIFRLTWTLFRLTWMLLRLTWLFRLTIVTFCHFTISCFNHALCSAPLKQAFNAGNYYIPNHDVYHLINCLATKLCVSLTCLQKLLRKNPLYTHAVGFHMICVSNQYSDDKIMATMNKEGVGKHKQQSPTN